MNLMTFIVLATITSSVHGEVFKCFLPEGKTVYQSTPCPDTAVKQSVIEIKKPDPAKIAEAEERLKAWEADMAKKEAAKAQVRKEQQEERDRQAAINALNRSAKAQEELANAAKQPTIINQPVLIGPFNPFPRPFNPHPQKDNDGAARSQRKHRTDRQINFR